MASDSNQINAASDFRLKSLILYGSTGASVILTDIMTELNIYEDVFSNNTVGNMLVIDTDNYINRIPIIGHEYLEVAFEKPDAPDAQASYRKVFRVYKIANREYTNMQTEQYILHFTSEEMLLNEQRRVSRSFSGKTISDMVSVIAKNELKIAPEHLKLTETTESLHTIVIPNWKPFYAINWLAARATSSQYPGASFFFFEDKEGYKFTSLEALSQKPAIMTVTVSPRNLSLTPQDRSNELNESQKNIYEYEMKMGMNSLQNLNRGMYAGTLVTVDALRQRIQNHPVGGVSLFNRTKHLNPKSSFSDMTNRFKKMETEEVYSQIALYPTTDGWNKLRYRAQATQYPNHVEDWLIQRQMTVSAYHQQRFKISVPGSTDLTAGKVINLSFPSLELQEKSGRKLDDLYSGKYIVSAVRHSFGRSGQTSFLEIMKDSQKEGFPTSRQDNDFMENLKK